MKHARKALNLVVRINPGGRRFYESVPVIELSDNRYRTRAGMRRRCYGRR
jgi:hypothetical protein